LETRIELLLHPPHAEVAEQQVKERGYFVEAKEQKVKRWG